MHTLFLITTTESQFNHSEVIFCKQISITLHRFGGKIPTIEITKTTKTHTTI
ncbi:hypothetical protein EVA_03192 [gut metagenome]|uniref:Uncharacterized protein n=1 Tax=gut metagenome TaxID=749906 RepID=J9GMF0_9ZZZZ